MALRKHRFEAHTVNAVCLQLQQANHQGDPEAAAVAREDYQQVRENVRIHDRALAAYVDLNVAVNYVDSFQFNEVKSFAQSVTQDSLFNAFTPVMLERSYNA